METARHAEHLGLTTLLGTGGYCRVLQGIAGHLCLTTAGYCKVLQGIAGYLSWTTLLGIVGYRTENKVFRLDNFAE